jgi:hypothetical protein
MNYIPQGLVVGLNTYSDRLQGLGASATTQTQVKTTPPPSLPTVSGPTGQAVATLPVITWKSATESNLFAYRGYNWQVKNGGLYLGAYYVGLSISDKLPLQIAIAIDKNWATLISNWKAAIAKGQSVSGSVIVPASSPASTVKLPTVSGPTIVTQNKPGIEPLLMNSPAPKTTYENVFGEMMNVTRVGNSIISVEYLGKKYNIDDKGSVKYISALLSDWANVSPDSTLYWNNPTSKKREPFTVFDINFLYAAKMGGLSPVRVLTNSNTQTNNAPNTPAIQTTTPSVVITWKTSRQSNLFAYRGYNFQFSPTVDNTLDKVDLRLGTHLVWKNIPIQLIGDTAKIDSVKVTGLIDSQWPQIMAAWKDSITQSNAINAVSSLHTTAAQTSVANNPLAKLQPQVISTSVIVENGVIKDVKLTTVPYTVPIPVILGVEKAAFNPLPGQNLPNAILTSGGGSSPYQSQADIAAQYAHDMQTVPGATPKAEANAPLLVMGAVAAYFLLS